MARDTAANYKRLDYERLDQVLSGLENEVKEGLNRELAPFMAEFAQLDKNLQETLDQNELSAVTAIATDSILPNTAGAAIDKFLPGAGTYTAGHINLVSTIEHKSQELDNRLAAYAEFSEERAQLIQKFKIALGKKLDDIRRGVFVPGQENVSVLQNEMIANDLLITMTQDPRLHPDFQQVAQGEAIALIYEQTGNTLTNLQKMSESIAQIQTDNEAHKANIDSMGSAIGVLSEDFIQLRNTLSDVITLVQNNQIDIAELQIGLESVRAGLGQVNQRLNQHELRLEKLEVIADLVFTELTKIDTRGLERYDENIARLATEYANLQENDSEDVEALLAKRAELQTEVNLRTVEIADLQEKLKHFFGVTNLLMQFGQIVGSPELQKASQIISGVAQVAIGIAAMFELGGEALNALVGGAALGPPGMIAGGLMTLFSLFGKSKGGSNGIAEALQQISKQIQSLSRQVSELGRVMNQRFDNIENILFFQRRLILRSFRETVELLNDFHRNMIMEFIDTRGQIAGVESIVEDISDKLHATQLSVENGLSELYGQEYTRVLTQYVNYYDHNPYGTIPSLSPVDVRQAYLFLINWAIQGAKSPTVNNDLSGEYGREQLLDISSDDLVNNINKLLGIYREQGFSLPFESLPSKIVEALTLEGCSVTLSGSNRVVNPLIYLSAVQAIMKMIERVPELKLTRSDRCQLQGVLNEGIGFLEQIQGLKANAGPINAALDDYEKNIKQFVGHVYRTTVNKSKLRGEDIHQELVQASTYANATSEQFRSLSSNVGQLWLQGGNIYEDIIRSCYIYSRVEPIYYTRFGYKISDHAVGQGYCAPDWPLANAGYHEIENAFPDVVLGVVPHFYNRPQPGLPDTDCHNVENIRAAYAYAQLGDSGSRWVSFWIADRIYYFLTSDRTQLFGPGLWPIQRPPYRPVDQEDALLITTFQNELDETAQKLAGSRWSSQTRQFTQGTFELNNSTLPQNFQSLMSNFIERRVDTNRAELTATLSKFAHVVNTCQVYFRGCPSSVIDINIDDGVNRLAAIRTSASSSLHLLNTEIPRTYTGLMDSFAQLTPIFESLTRHLRFAKLLDIENLYHLSELTTVQLRTMLEKIILWFDADDNEIEKTEVLHTLLTEIDRRGPLYEIMKKIDIAKKSLSLYLPLAFQEEFYTDEPSQLILRLMFDSNRLTLGLSDYLDPQNGTQPLFESIREQFRVREGLVSLNGSVVLPNFEFLPAARDYFQGVVARGQQAVANDQLVPSYLWFLNKLYPFVSLINLARPAGLAYNDITAAGVYAWARGENPELNNVIDAPLADLVNKRDAERNTAYLLAAEDDCNRNATAVLYERGARVNEVNADDDSAIDLAMQCNPSDNRVEHLELLLAQGATECKPSNRLVNALHDIGPRRPELVANIHCVDLPDFTPSAAPETTTPAPAPTSGFTTMAPTESPDQGSTSDGETISESSAMVAGTSGGASFSTSGTMDENSDSSGASASSEGPGLAPVVVNQAEESSLSGGTILGITLISAATFLGATAMVACRSRGGANAPSTIQRAMLVMASALGCARGENISMKASDFSTERRTDLVSLNRVKLFERLHPLNNNFYLYDETWMPTITVKSVLPEGYLSRFYDFFNDGINYFRSANVNATALIPYLSPEARARQRMFKFDIIMDELSGWPIFSYTAVDHDGYVAGRLNLVGNPTLCFSSDGLRTNVVESSGVFSEFNIEAARNNSNGPCNVCEALPPTYSERLVSHASSSAKHGAIRGGTKLLGNYLMKKGCAKNAVKLASGTAYYSAMFLMETMNRVSMRNGESDTMTDLTESATGAAYNTARLFFAEQCMSYAARASRWLGSKARTHGLQRTAKCFDTVADYSGVGVFAYRTYHDGVAATAVSVASGAAAESAVVSLGGHFIESYSEQQSQPEMIQSNQAEGPSVVAQHHFSPGPSFSAG